MKVDAAAGFFRVFDVAFFVPGSTLMIVIALNRYDLVEPFGHLKGLGWLYEGAQPTAFGVGVLSLVGVLCSFVSGLLCHSVARMLRLMVHRVRTGATPANEPVSTASSAHSANGADTHTTVSPVPRSALQSEGGWYGAVEPSALTKLVEYWWYLRGTCTNLAVALIIGTILTLCPIQSELSRPVPCWLLVGMAALFFFLARDYNEAVQKGAFHLERMSGEAKAFRTTSKIAVALKTR